MGGIICLLNYVLIVYPPIQLEFTYQTIWIILEGKCYLEKHIETIKTTFDNHHIYDHNIVSNVNGMLQKKKIIYKLSTTYGEYKYEEFLFI